MNLTDEARTALKQAIINFDQPGAGIHLFSSQGCCGPKVNMEISTKPGLNETKVILDDVDFYIENDLIPTVLDVTIDHTERGFILNRQKKTESCCQ